MKLEKKILVVKILLTFGALEFFGPVLRDTNSSHLLNQDWIGHARFHLMWNILLWASIGIYSIYLLWGKKEITLGNLYQVMGFQVMNALAFWGAVVFGDFYNADVFDERIHIGILNVNENIIVFGLLSALLTVNFILIKKTIEKELNGAIK